MYVVNGNPNVYDKIQRIVLLLIINHNKFMQSAHMHKKRYNFMNSYWNFSHLINLQSSKLSYIMKENRLILIFFSLC